VKSEVAHKIGHVKLESAEILKSFENLKVVLIVAVSFIGGRKQRTQRKLLTCRKSLTSFIT
jgi:hypothetical protein